MSDEPLRRGAKPLSEKDWLFGSRPRRRLLESILIGPAPKTAWTRPELADMAGVVANGGVDEHLDGLTRLGLLEVEDDSDRRWRAAQPRPQLGKALRRVLILLGDTSDAPPPRARRTNPGLADAAQALRGAERAIVAARTELGAETADELLGLLDQVRRRLNDALPQLD